MHRDHVGALEELVQRGGGVGDVGIEGQHVHPQTAKAPAQSPSDRAQAHQADRLAGQLPGPVPLVGDLAVAVDVTGTHVLVGRDQSTGGGEEEGYGELGHRVRVASGCSQDGDAGRRRRGDVDVGGVAAAAGHGDDRLLVELGTAHIALDHDDVGALRRHPVGQLPGVVDAELGLIEPRIEHKIRQLAEQVESGTAHRGGDQGFRPSAAQSCCAPIVAVKDRQ